MAERKRMRKELRKLEQGTDSKSDLDLFEEVGVRSTLLWQVNLLKGMGLSSRRWRNLCKCVTCSWFTTAAHWVAGTSLEYSGFIWSKREPLM